MLSDVSRLTEARLSFIRDGRIMGGCGGDIRDWLTDIVADRRKAVAESSDVSARYGKDVRCADC